MSQHKKADLQFASLPMVDDMGIEPTTSAMRKDFENFFGLFLFFLAVFAGFHFICKPLKRAVLRMFQPRLW